LSPPTTIGDAGRELSAHRHAEATDFYRLFMMVLAKTPGIAMDVIIHFSMRLYTTIYIF
jgi:hypothetical protein